MIPAGTTHCTDRQRRLIALLLFAWLNLIVQPCLAGMPEMPAGMEHCDHGDATDHGAPCPLMHAADCQMAADMNADSSRAAAPPRAGALLALLPFPDVARAGALRTTRDDPGDSAGPSLNIRYCNLRN
jgi:hypothetical protein